MFAVALVLYTLAMALAIGVGDWIHGIGYYVTGLIQLLMMIILYYLTDSFLLSSRYGTILILQCHIMYIYLVYLSAADIQRHQRFGVYIHGHQQHQQYRFHHHQQLHYYQTRVQKRNNWVIYCLATRGMEQRHQ